MTVAVYSETLYVQHKIYVVCMWFLYILKQGLWIILQRMSKTDYADAYQSIDFRKYLGKYLIGRGEQGVLMAEPYRSEILPYWKFATPDKAEKLAKKIYSVLEQYRETNDFVGMDLARKFLQMGFTRSRRYANYSSANKHADNETVKSHDESSDKASIGNRYLATKDKHKIIQKRLVIEPLLEILKSTQRGDAC